MGVGQTVYGRCVQHGPGTNHRISRLPAPRFGGHQHARLRRRVRPQMVAKGGPVGHGLGNCYPGTCHVRLQPPGCLRVGAEDSPQEPPAVGGDQDSHRPQQQDPDAHRHPKDPQDAQPGVAQGSFEGAPKNVQDRNRNCARTAIDRVPCAEWSINRSMRSDTCCHRAIWSAGRTQTRDGKLWSYPSRSAQD